MSKIVIIGGGMAGISAGIIAARKGYETVIYEKNAVPGGNCSYWKRGKYTIDNCIHWLIGTHEGDPQYLEWQELGALGPEVPIVERESFYSCEWDDEKITLWRDLDRTEREMLALSPRDEKEIRRFIDSVKLAEGLMMPKENPFDFKNAFQEVNLSASRTEVTRILFEYGGLTLEQVADRFYHPLLKRVFLDFSVPEYEAYWLVLSYSFFVAGNADVPLGGSKGMIERMLATYKNEGGELHLSTPVSQVVIGKEKRAWNAQIWDPKSINLYKVKKIVTRDATGVVLADGTFVAADYVICACDPNYTFGHLLKKKYTPRALTKIQKNKEKNVIYSSVQAAFAVDGEMEEVKDTLYFKCDPMDVGKGIVDRLMVKNYRNYGDYIAPEGQTVIQVMIYQHEKDYSYWTDLRKKMPAYQMVKKNLADAIIYRIEERFPQYEGKIHTLDVWTPCTYSRQNNDYHGAYMRFITSLVNTKAFLSSDVKHLRNVFLASHWLRYPGGLPTAATMGKFAITRIELLEKGNELEDHADGENPARPET